jgi:hypothetical protein
MKKLKSFLLISIALVNSNSLASLRPKTGQAVPEAEFPGSSYLPSCYKRYLNESEEVRNKIRQADQLVEQTKNSLSKLKAGSSNRGGLLAFKNLFETMQKDLRRDLQYMRRKAFKDCLGRPYKFFAESWQQLKGYFK